MWPYYAPYLIIGAALLTLAAISFTAYAISRLVTVKDGHQGVNYHMGKLTILKPGLHFLLSPFHYYHGQMSVQQQVISLPDTDIFTADRIPMKVNATLTYRVTDVEKNMLNVNNFANAIVEIARVTLASIIRNYTFQNLTPINTDHSRAATPDESSDGPTPVQQLNTNADAKRLATEIHNQFVYKLKDSVKDRLRVYFCSHLQ